MKKIFANNDKNAYALVDDDVFETIQQMSLKFCITKKGYFRSTTEIKLPVMLKKKRLLLHHLVWIMETGELPVRTVDHINRDPGNNQFENLRLATRKEQQQNRGKHKNNTSGYIGVSHHHYHDKRRKKNNVSDYWRAQILRQDGKCEQKYFPYTKNGLQHAASWYDSKAREYYGEFHGQLNFTDDQNKTA